MKARLSKDKQGSACRIELLAESIAENEFLRACHEKGNIGQITLSLNAAPLPIDLSFPFSSLALTFSAKED